jgi:hypothetical protein
MIRYSFDLGQFYTSLFNCCLNTGHWTWYSSRPVLQFSHQTRRVGILSNVGSWWSGWSSKPYFSTTNQPPIWNKSMMFIAAFFFRKEINIWLSLTTSLSCVVYIYNNGLIDRQYFNYISSLGPYCVFFFCLWSQRNDFTTTLLHHQTRPPCIVEFYSLRPKINTHLVF